MVEGIVAGALGGLLWVVVLVLTTVPWVQDRFSETVCGVVGQVAFVVIAFPVMDRAGDLADDHGTVIGYGSVIAAAAVTIAVLGLVARRAPVVSRWWYGRLPLGRVPAPKSRSVPRPRRG